MRHLLVPSRALLVLLVFLCHRLRHILMEVLGFPRHHQVGLLLHHKPCRAHLHALSLRLARPTSTCNLILKNEWASFMKTISLPQIEKHKLFAECQEGARKDVERAFGVLQARFNIVRRPAKKWKRKSVGKIMLACVILHNIIVEDERGCRNLQFVLVQSIPS